MPAWLYHIEAPLDPEDLPRPPLAALRALRVTGVLLSRAGWEQSPFATRLAIAVAGARDRVDRDEVREALGKASPREMKMVPALGEPGLDAVPEPVLRASGPGRTVPLAFWQALRPLDRHVLLMLSNNTRLLWRVLDELMARTRGGAALATRTAWTGELGRCELRVQPSTARRLAAPHFLEGRALILARVAGIRAARSTGDLLDLASQIVTGPVELGLRAEPDESPARVLCQAHVSTAEGEFFPAASLLAAAAAAAALLDMVRADDPGVRIEGLRIAEEPWAVHEEDETTIHG